MKIIKNIGSKFLVVLIGVGLFSCSLSDFGDLNVDPNNTTVPQTNNLLTQALRNLPGTRNASTGSLYAQYIANSQYTSADNYQTITFSYNGWYNGPLADLQFIININSDPETATGAQTNGSNANQIAVAQILQSYFYLHITDRWGDIPYTEALQAFNAESQILTPAFDRQDAIYNDIFTTLANAVNSISTTDPVVGDILFDGDMNRWKQFANSIRATAALRIRKADPAKGAAEFNAAISADQGVVTSNAENIVYQHLSEANNQNAWYASFITREDWTVAAPLLDYMQIDTYTNPHPKADGSISTGAMDVQADPRIAVYANPAADNGEYVGMPYGLTEATAGDINNIYISLLGDAMRQQDSPEYLYHAAQMHFAAAEAMRLGWITSFNGMSSVQELYEAAIGASMDQWGVDIGSYLSNSEVAYDAARAEEQIATQKWIAMYLMGYESWFEWRATTSASNPKGYPALDAATNAQNPGGNNGIPVRQGYPTQERDLNGDNYDAALSAQGFANDDLTGYVWWDRQ